MRKIVASVKRRMRVHAMSIDGYLEKMGGLYQGRLQFSLEQDCRSAVVRALLQNPKQHDAIYVIGYRGYSEAIHVLTVDKNKRPVTDTWRGTLDPRSMTYTVKLPSGMETLDVVRVLPVAGFLRRWPRHDDALAA